MRPLIILMSGSDPEAEFLEHYLSSCHQANRVSNPWGRGSDPVNSLLPFFAPVFGLLTQVQVMDNVDIAILESQHHRSQNVCLT